MEELTLQTMIAVFEEMFGAGLFWAMVATAVIITLAYVYVLIRDKARGHAKVPDRASSSCRWARWLRSGSSW